MYPPPESPQPSPFPAITVETRTKLEEELRLNEDHKTASVVASITGERPLSSVNALGLLTETVFGRAMAYNRGFVQEIFQSLKEVYTEGNYFDGYKAEAATKGMAVVLQAYQIETREEVLSGLGNLKEEDLLEVKSITRETLASPAGLGVPTLQRLLEAPKIPEQNTELNLCLNKAAERGTLFHELLLRDGGVAMYRILSRMWPKLGIPPRGPENPSS